MTPAQAQWLIEAILNAPSIPLAQVVVEQHLAALDQTFLNVLEQQIHEAQCLSGPPRSFSPWSLPGGAVDVYLQMQSRSAQRLQGLQLLRQYVHNRLGSAGGGGPPATPEPAGPLQFTCARCGLSGPILCPGQGRHPPSATVVPHGGQGICTLCGAPVSFVTCRCGQVTPLRGAGPPESPPEALPADEPPPPGAEEATRAASADGPASWLGMAEQLRRMVNQEAADGVIEPGRAAGLQDILGDLDSLIQKSGTDRPLAEMAQDQSKLEELFRRLRPSAEEPSLPGPALPAGSRAAWVQQRLAELKLFLGEEAMQHARPEGERAAVFDLYRRLGHLTTALHETRGEGSALGRLEVERVRHLVNEVRAFGRRRHLMLARPLWSGRNAPQDPNLVFFAGPEPVGQLLREAARARGLRLCPPVRPGADVAAARWQDLRAASLAVFDVTPQPPADAPVYYELGIALTLGTELLLLIRQGSDPPFDIAQQPVSYGSVTDLGRLLPAALDTALYGVQCRGTVASCLDGTLAYAERLAQAEPAHPYLGVELRGLRGAAHDPTQFRAQLTAFNARLGTGAHELVCPRWPGRYPDPQAPRCFLVMPFRDNLSPYARGRLKVAPGVAPRYRPEPLRDLVEGTCRQVGVTFERGDTAAGQHILEEAVWGALGRATHVVCDLTGLNLNVCLELGMAHTLGRRTLLLSRETTESVLFDGIRKLRCRYYAEEPGRDEPIRRALEEFLKER
jgi:hypothetical protein